MKKSALLLLVGFVVLMAGAYALYGSLSQRVSPVAEGPLMSREEPEQGKEAPGEEAGAEDGNIYAPNFTAVDREGNEVEYDSLTGVPVVLNFWASWCGPCKVEMPDFQKVYEEYGEEELRFLMVNITDGRQETLETATAFLEQSGYTFPVWFDIYRQAAYSYGIRSMPTTVFIDAQGVVAGAWEGYMPEDQLREAIAAILPEEGDAASASPSPL